MSKTGYAKVFVVHGHDQIAREQLELVLHRLNLEPYVLQNTSGDGLTIIEALEQYIGQKAQAGFGIVLLTPDDMGYSKKDWVNDHVKEVVPKLTERLRAAGFPMDPAAVSRASA